MVRFEFKWKNSRAKPPAAWLKTYPDSSYELIHRENFLPFVS